MAEPSRDVISFGPFRLYTGERLLTRDGTPVELGGRALDILIALVSARNGVVSKKDLLSRVWPDVTVEESSLRFHIAGLRKMLGDGKDGVRYITTLAGRGYCFVAPVSRVRLEAEAVADFRYANLPSRLVGLIGREGDLEHVVARLEVARFVTVVGAGGVGKTTLAIAVGHELKEAFVGAVLFIDLSPLSDPDIISGTVASMLGLPVRSDDATPNLIAYLRDKRILLILDTCEHLVDAVAALAARIFIGTSAVHILATSREALQVDGEQVYRLDPLACPPEDAVVTAAIARTFPAPQLFVERAVASGARLDFGDAEAAIVVSICRKLGGVTLAIELAARRVQAYGLHQTAALLDQRLILLWLGPRTAPPRQRTLQASLDWSYGLLSDVERLVLRRLAVFVGRFTLDAALAVARSANVDDAAVFSAIDSLITKSMVAPSPVGAMMRYRLLDTTRAYTLAATTDDPDVANVRVRHATYFQRWLEQNGEESATLSSGVERSLHFADLNNVRVALEWCFGEEGDLGTGIKLAAAAAPVFLATSLLPECYRWSQRAIVALDGASRGEEEEMRLQASFGAASMHIYGPSDAARAALSRSLAIAEARGNVPTQVGVLGTLSMFCTRDGEFKIALDYGKRALAIAETCEDLDATALAKSTLGRALHFVGDHNSARSELEASYQHWSRAQRTYLGLDDRILVGLGLARSLWVQGHPAEAEDRARETVKDAESSANAVSLALALAWVPDVFIWSGDLGTAEEHADRLVAHAQSHSLVPYLYVGHAYKGTLAIHRGNPKSGVETLRDCLKHFHAVHYEMRNTEFKIVLAQGLLAMRRADDAITLIDSTIALVEENGDFFFMPEALRIKGCALLSRQQPQVEDAQACFMQSLDLSRRQAARAWELRSAIDLVRVLAQRGEAEFGRALLESVFAQFAQGRDTTDLRTAKRLLAELVSRCR